MYCQGLHYMMNVTVTGDLHLTSDEKIIPNTVMGVTTCYILKRMLKQKYYTCIRIIKHKLTL